MSSNEHPLDANVDVVSNLIAVENGDASPLETLEFFGYLVRHPHILRGLQGTWQRAVQSAIEGDLIDPETGDLTDTATAALGDLDESEEF